MTTTNSRFTLTTEVLAKSGLERLVACANHKRQWSVLFVEDHPEFGMKTNATLKTVESYMYSPYTAKAHFEVNRLADGLPFGAIPMAKSLIPRTLLIKQITAGEIVSQHGIKGRLYVGLTSNPGKTTDLVDRLNELYNLGVTKADILEQVIPNGSSCVMVRFNKMSVTFTGNFLVDLYTPLDLVPPPAD